MKKSEKGIARKEAIKKIKSAKKFILMCVEDEVEDYILFVINIKCTDIQKKINLAHHMSDFMFERHSKDFTDD